MLSIVSPLFFCPSKWVLCASKRRTGPWGKVAVKLVSFSTRLVDSQHVRWRLVLHTICVCSYYAPHAGVDESDRVSFWQDLVASTAHVVSVLPHSTLILSGDANVWHPHFSWIVCVPETMPSSLTFNNCLTWDSPSAIHVHVPHTLLVRWICCLFPAIRSLLSSLSIMVTLVVPTTPFAVPA